MDIGIQRRQEKEGAQNGLSFRNPGHRFHVDGMDGEKKGDDGGFIRSAGHPQQEKKQKQRIQNMDRQIHHEVVAGLQTEKLAVDHVGNPGERVPVGYAREGKSPPEVWQSQSCVDMGVFSDIFVIVKIEELVMSDLGIGKKGDRRDCA